MIQRLLKIYIFAVILLTDFVMFADDDPGNLFEDEYGNIDTNIEEAPINHRLVLLGIAGIIFIFYYFKNKHQPTAK